MRLRNKTEERIDFSKGIDAWNKQSSEGTGVSSIYARSHPYNMRENPDGFVDDILNMVFDNEGKLIGRLPVKHKALNSPWYPNSARAESTKQLSHPSHHSILWALTSGTTQSFFNRDALAPVFTHDWLALINPPAAVLYDNYWYIYARPAAANAGIKVLNQAPWTKTTFVPAYAGGYGGLDFAIVWKDRVFGRAATDRKVVVWSKTTDPTVWATPDGGFVKIDEDIRDIIIYNDTLYILTATNALWAFSYEADPSTDGYLRRIIESGAMPGGAYGNLTVSNNELYVAGASNVYRIINNNAIPIADQLHVDLNGVDEAAVWNIGFGLLYRTVYTIGGRDNQDLWVYNYDNDAWTRIHYEYGNNDIESDSMMIRSVWYDITNQYEQKLWMFHEGSSTIPGDPGGSYGRPIYQWYINAGYFQEPGYDYILTSWDGSGGGIYKQIKHRLDTGIKYQANKDTFKRYWNFLFDAFLGFRQQGTTAPNLTPYKTTIQFIPENRIQFENGELQRTPESVLAGTQYVVLVNQRARGIRLIWETIVTVTYATFQDTSTPAETVDARPIINAITLIYDPIERKRFLPNSTANTDAGVQ
jgi:hypothetical protein